MKLIATNNTSIDIQIEHLDGYVLPANASNVDLLSIGSGYSLEDIYETPLISLLNVTGEISLIFEGKYRIESDATIGEFLKDPLSYNYKSELINNNYYTPVFYIKNEGTASGTLEKTEYYKNYVDSQNKGDLIIEVTESYNIDQSDSSVFNSAKKCISRTKTWKLVDVSGAVDHVKVKTKTKLYNTRRKQHIEGIRRRTNIEEQLIDNVALAGILSGVFVSESDAFEKLVALQMSHNDALQVWIASGRGEIYSEIANDTVNTWLSSVVADNPATNTMCPWIIGMSFKDYIVSKLKAEIR